MSYRQQMLEVMRERERLLVRCHAQRTEIPALVRQLEGPIKVADSVVAGISYLRRHPVVLGVLVATLVIIRRRGWARWAQRGFMLWRAYRAFGSSRRGA